MIFLSYKNITDELEKDISRVVERLKEAGINVRKQNCDLHYADYIILVVENVISFIENEKEFTIEQKWIKEDIKINPNKYIFIYK